MVGNFQMKMIGWKLDHLKSEDEEMAVVTKMQ